VRFLRDPVAEYARLFRRYGDLVLVRLGPWPFVLVNDPAHVKTLLVDEARSFGKDPLLPAVRRALGDGLLTSMGERHRQDKRALGGAFGRPMLRRYAGAIARAAERTCATWSPGELDVEREMGATSLAIIAEVLFGADLGPEAYALRAAVEVVATHLPWLVVSALPGGALLPLPGVLRVRRAVAVLDAYVAGLVARRRAEPPPDAPRDLLDVLLAEGYGAAALRDHVVTLLVTGHETVAHALTWSLWELAGAPEVQDGLRDQVVALAGQRPLEADDLPGLGASERVFAEALRLSPPGWSFCKRVERPVELAGRRLPVGAHVLLCPLVLHKDPRWWAEPERFDPDRFLRPYPRYAYVPFSHGPRACVAAELAKVEGTLVLATLLRRFRVARVPGVAPRRRWGYTTGLEGGLRLSVHDPTDRA